MLLSLVVYRRSERERAARPHARLRGCPRSLREYRRENNSRENLEGNLFMRFTFDDCPKRSCKLA